MNKEKMVGNAAAPVCQKKILVIGSLNIDMVVGVDHTPAAGETILSNGNMEMIPGGKGANQACAAGCLGANVIMLGAVGNDMYADRQLQSLKQAGVDVSRVIRRADSTTGLAFITVNCDGDNSIVVVSGANATLSEKDIDDNIDLIKESDIVILQLEIPLSTVCCAAKTAKSLGKMVILDPAPVPQKFPEELYGYVDIIKPNETELSMLTGVENTEENLEQATELLRNKGVKDVLVTLGGNGVYLNSSQLGIHRIPAVKVEAIDTTAAGDSFTAALAIMLAEGKNLEEAAIFANYVSSIVVTRKGAQSSIPTLDEVTEYIEKIAAE